MPTTSRIAVVTVCLLACVEGAPPTGTRHVASAAPPTVATTRLARESADAVADVTSTAPASPPARVADAPTHAPASPTVVVEGCDGGRIRIPGGTFRMGADDDEYSRPEHEVTIGPYCLDRTEVTVAEYLRCLEAGRCTNTYIHCGMPTDGRSNHPMVCVTWDHAVEYCASVGGRLPTEAEWEFAARSSDGRRFPWGNDPPRDQPCWSGITRRDHSSCEVGSHPGDVSPFGILDMAGNVAEWVADWYAPYSSEPSLNPRGPDAGDVRVYREGSWAAADPRMMHSDFRMYTGPGGRELDLGFRCASDVAAPPPPPPRRRRR